MKSVSSTLVIVSLSWNSKHVPESNRIVNPRGMLLFANHFHTPCDTKAWERDDQKRTRAKPSVHSKVSVPNHTSHIGWTLCFVANSAGARARKRTKPACVQQAYIIRASENSSAPAVQVQRQGHPWDYSLPRLWQPVYHVHDRRQNLEDSAHFPPWFRRLAIKIYERCLHAVNDVC